MYGSWRRSMTWVAAAGVVLAAGAARAEGPAFDCAKAQGEVEPLICQDTELAALDRQLDGVYKAALGKARDGMDKTLRAEQRGWVKGRNECWKAKGDDPVYLTESWTVTGVRDCVRANYQGRISELQAIWRLVPSKGPTFFACDGNPSNEVVATFFETDPPAARLERGDTTITAWLVPAGSGSKYEGQNVTFWNKGNEATVTWRGSDLKCQAQATK